jgi:OOP family OmpA-OmpF porin
MRGLLGGILLVAGVGGLGWYASQGPAVSIEAALTNAAAEIAGSAQHDVSATVSGRDITVAGFVEDRTEQDALLAAFDDIAGRRIVNADAVEVLPVASPFFFSIVKDEAGTTASGNVPSASVAETLGFDGLDVANGEPDEAWPDAAAAVLAAVAPLKAANVVMADASVAVTGIAATPNELAAFNDLITALPEGYTATSEIDVEDDGTPLRLALNYDGTTLSGSGKIPADLDIEEVMITDTATSLDLNEGLAPSPDGAWPAFVKAALAALGALQDGDVALEGQTMTLSGTGTPAEIAAAEAALSDLPDGYAATTDISIFDDGVPFSLAVTKSDDGITASGKVPADFDAALLQSANTETLDTAFITDDTGVWPDIAAAGLAGLDALERGTLQVTTDTVSLNGEAQTPTERDAAIAALAGIDATTDIALLDDGLPVSVNLTYDAQTGASVAGKLPAGVAPEDIAAALGIAVADDGTDRAGLSSDIDILSAISSLRPFLPELSRMTYTATGEAASLEATAVPGADADRLGAALQTALGDTVAVDVAARSELPASGATRTNIFTGEQEVFTSGYWLPTFDFFATPESCTAQSDSIQARDQVQFVTGSAELDIQSIRAINALSALARKCALEGGVFLQVAGHTDNTGDPEANLALSQARADAVRDAILDRGLARSVVTAVGFGDTQPIADNETEEGRAANRRTAFNWNFE